MNPRFERARLDDAAANTIRSLEQDLKCRIVALRPKARLANLSSDQVATLHRMEKEFGTALVAYEAKESFRVATVLDPELKRIQQFEKDTNLILVAYQENREEADVQDFRPGRADEVADLSEDQAKRLQHGESAIHLVLMAYKKS